MDGGEASQCASSDTARMFYGGIIDSAWKETFGLIIASLNIFFKSQEIETMQKHIDEAKSESYPFLYTELFSKLDAKRQELRKAASPENNLGELWRQGKLDIDRLTTEVKKSLHFPMCKLLETISSVSKKKQHRTLYLTELGHIASIHTKAALLSRLPPAALLSRLPQATLLSRLRK